MVASRDGVGVRPTIGPDKNIETYGASRPGVLHPVELQSPGGYY